MEKVCGLLVKKVHLMIRLWFGGVKKEAPWNPSVTISHNHIIIKPAVAKLQIAASAHVFLKKKSELSFSILFKRYDVRCFI